MSLYKDCFFLRSTPTKSELLFFLRLTDPSSGSEFEVMFELMDQDDVVAVAKYGKFRVLDQAGNYALEVSDFSPSLDILDAGDSFGDASGSNFSHPEMDLTFEKNCTGKMGGAGW